MWKLQYINDSNADLEIIFSTKIGPPWNRNRP